MVLRNVLDVLRNVSVAVHLSEVLLWHHLVMLESRWKGLLRDVLRHVLHLRVLRSWLANFKLGTALLVVASSSVHASIPPVLYGVVASSSQSSRDLGPSLSHLGDHLLDHDTFLRGDRVMVEIRLQVLVVSLSALLGGPGLDGGRYPHPVVGSMDIDEMQEHLVFLLRPGAAFVLRHVGLNCCWLGNGAVRGQRGGPAESRESFGIDDGLVEY